MREHEPDAASGCLILREDMSTRRGVELRCGNPSCGITGRRNPLPGQPPAWEPSFLGVFFPGTCAYVKCRRCRAINRIEVLSAHAFSVEIEDAYPVCPVIWKGRHAV